MNLGHLWSVIFYPRLQTSSPNPTTTSNRRGTCAILCQRAELTIQIELGLIAEQGFLEWSFCSAIRQEVYCAYTHLMQPAPMTGALNFDETQHVSPDA